MAAKKSGTAKAKAKARPKRRARAKASAATAEPAGAPPTVPNAAEGASEAQREAGHPVGCRCGICLGHLTPGNPGNSGGKAGRSGRPKNAWKRFARELLDDDGVRDTIELAARAGPSRANPGWANMLRWLDERAHGKPTQPIRHAGRILVDMDV